jgi:metallo-beta-lactamase class B
MIRRILLSLSISALMSAAGLFAQGNPDWHREFPAFKIAGNIYYVGTADLAVYLIHTTDGNILINSNFKEDLPLLKQSIASLGFKYSETKVVLISHAHGDHDEGVGEIQKETHAKVMVMDADVKDVQSTAPGRPGAHVDRVLHDGDSVVMGGSRWIAHLTPGHTKGCTTWTTRLRENNRIVNVVIVGSPNVNSGYYLVGNKNYPGIAEDYVMTFAVLKGQPCDVFLGAHGEYFGLKDKYEKLKAGDKNAFVDPQGYQAWVAMKEKAFRDEWERAKQNPGIPKP